MEKRTFQKCEAEVKEKKDLKGLFELWREAHEAETREVAQYFQDDKIENKKWWFDEKYHKNKLNQKCTVSSHFSQFFDDVRCQCAMGEHEKTSAWEYVLANAFNPDGPVGELTENKYSYKYFVLLKEANDSSKVCVRNYSQEQNFANKWISEWQEKENKAPMLEILQKSFSERKINFPEEVAYMNINKRGGTSSTTGWDATAVVNYAKKYREFILKEIDLLSEGQQEVTVFICGKDASKIYGEKGNYAELVKETLEEVQNVAFLKGKNVKFVSVTHPSGRIKADDLADEMELGERNENLPNR